MATICKTPGAVYSCRIGGTLIRLEVKLPFDPFFTEDDVTNIESDLHNAVEAALSPLFVKRMLDAPYCPHCGTRKASHPHSDGCPDKPKRTRRARL